MTEYDDDDGFYGYVETTNNPGSYLLLGTALFCLGTQLLLPCFVILGRRYEKRRLEAEERARAFYGEEEERGTTAHADGTGAPTKKNEQTLDTMLTWEKDGEKGGKDFGVNASSGSHEGGIEALAVARGHGTKGVKQEGKSSSSSSSAAAGQSRGRSAATSIPVARSSSGGSSQSHLQQIQFRNTVVVMNDEYAAGSKGDKNRAHDDALSVAPSSYVHGRVKRTRNASGGSVTSDSIVSRNSRRSAGGVADNVMVTARGVVDKMIMPPYPDDADGSLISGTAYAQRKPRRDKKSKTSRSVVSASGVSAMSKGSTSVHSRTSRLTATSVATTTFLDAGVGRRRHGRGGRRYGRGATDHYRRANRGAAEERRVAEEKRLERRGMLLSPQTQATAATALSGREGDDDVLSRGKDLWSDTGSRVKGPGSALSASDLVSRISFRGRSSSGGSNPHDSHSIVSHDSSYASGSGIRIRRTRSGSPQPSMMSKIVDDISPNDAADADDPGQYILPREDDDDKSVDLCCGERACWKPVMIMRAFDYLIELAEYDNETRRILKLSLPFTISAIMEAVLEAVTLALISQFIGTSAVAAYAVVDIVVGISSEFVGGIIDSEATLCSHAIGAGNNILAGQYFQLSVIIYVICQIPFVIIWSLFVDDVMKSWLHFDDHIADLAQDFARVAIWNDIVTGLAEAYHGLLEVSDHENWATFLGITEGLTEVCFVALAVILFDASLQHVAIIMLINGVLFLFVNVACTLWKGWMRPYLPGIVGSLALKNRVALSTLVRTAAPLSCGSVLAYGEWEILTIFAAELGPAEVATWAILGSIWDTFEASTEGIGDASEVRCAYHLGKGSPEMARRSSYKSILLGIIFSVFVTSVFFIMGDDLPTWFTSDPTLQHMISELIPLVGVGNITMTFGMVCWALVGAQGRYRLATFVAFFSSWCITMPLAAMFVYAFHVDLQGVTSAVVIGYSVSGTILSYILIRSDWERLSKIVQELNAITGEVYSSDSESDDDDDDESSSSSSESSSSSSDSSDSDSEDDSDK